MSGARWKKMFKEINITVENNLVMEKKDLNIYHHATRSAHMICFESSVTLPLKSACKDDYLTISVAPGYFRHEKDHFVDLPSWGDVECCTGEISAVLNSQNRTRVRIPPGKPMWQLRISRADMSSHQLTAARIFVSDCDFLEKMHMSPQGGYVNSKWEITMGRALNK